jgi:transcriptional regulator with XRE-family HTH domain
MESDESDTLLDMVTAAQCRAARGLLDWSQQDLAAKARVGIVTVRQLEGGVNEPRRATLEVVRLAFESAGVEFIDENGGGAGVRLRNRSPTKY